MANSGGHGGNSISCVSLSPDETFYISGSASGVVTAHGIQTEELLETVSVHKSAITAIRLGNQDLLFEADADSRIECAKLSWNDRGEEGAAVSAKKHWAIDSAHDDLDVTGLASADNGALLASSGKDECVRIWDVETQKQIAKLEGHKGWVKCVALGTSVDGSDPTKLVFSGGRDKAIRLWDVRMAGYREVHSLQGHHGWVHSLDLCTEGEPKIVSSSGDKTVRVWDLGRLSQEHMLVGHTLRAWSAAVNRAGDAIVSGASDGTVRLWQKSTLGFKDTVIAQHDDAVLAVAISGQGSLLVYGTEDGLTHSLRPTEQMTSSEEAISSPQESTILATGSVVSPPSQMGVPPLSQMGVSQLSQKGVPPLSQMGVPPFSQMDAKALEELSKAMPELASGIPVGELNPVSLNTAHGFLNNLTVRPEAIKGDRAQSSERENLLQPISADAFDRNGESDHGPPNAEALPPADTPVSSKPLFEQAVDPHHVGDPSHDSHTAAEPDEGSAMQFSPETMIQNSKDPQIPLRDEMPESTQMALTTEVPEGDEVVAGNESTLELASRVERLITRIDDLLSS